MKIFLTAQHEVLKVHPCCSRRQNFLLKAGWVTVSLWIFRFTHSRADGHLGCFRFWLRWTLLLGTRCRRCLFANPPSVLWVWIQKWGAKSHSNSWFNFGGNCHTIWG